MAKAAAVARARDAHREAVVTPFEVAQDESVTVGVREEANTVVLARVSFLKHLGLQHALARATHHG